MRNADRKAIATDFLRSARRGDRATIERLVTPTARHHNAYFPAGMSALLDAMVAASKDAPDRSLDIKHIVSEGEFVVVHSHTHHHPGDRGFAVVHIFRFEGDRIAELWDLGQPIPEDLPNSDGMF